MVIDGCMGTFGRGWFHEGTVAVSLFSPGRNSARRIETGLLETSETHVPYGTQNEHHFAFHALAGISLSNSDRVALIAIAFCNA